MSVSKEGGGMDWQDALEGKVLASQPDNLTLIPGSHMVEGENQLLTIVLGPPQVSPLPQ